LNRATPEKVIEMAFWDLKTLKLDEFRPGILSKVESGANLTMAFMQIAADKEGTPHDHPFDQCGVVVEGEIEMSIGEETTLVKLMEAYFIPAGITHSWKTHDRSATILDVTANRIGS
jgi:quercetin dioxygenase-like cupin family protein